MSEVTVFPIIEWATQTTPAGYGVLSIKILPVELGDMRPADPGKTAQSHHFGIAAQQAELLARDLTEMAATLREKRRTSN